MASFLLKLLLFLSLSAVSVIAEVPKATSVSFYVDATTGSDRNSGSSPNDAWSTLAAASERVSAAMNASPASSVEVLLARDSLFLNEGLAIVSAAFNGTLAVGAFGNASLPRPLVQHARGLTDIGAVPCIRIGAPLASATSISGLRLSGCTTGLSVLGSSGTAAPTSNVVVAENLLTDIKTSFLRYTPPNPHWAPAILLSGGRMANVTVRNNIGSRIDVFFQSQSNVNKLTLDSNTVQACSGNCYSMVRPLSLSLPP